jgi:hypothetical protein
MKGGGYEKVRFHRISLWGLVRGLRNKANGGFNTKK